MPVPSPRLQSELRFWAEATCATKRASAAAASFHRIGILLWVNARRSGCRAAARQRSIVLAGRVAVSVAGLIGGAVSRRAVRRRRVAAAVSRGIGGAISRLRASSHSAHHGAGGGADRGTLAAASRRAYRSAGSPADERASRRVRGGVPRLGVAVSWGRLGIAISRRRLGIAGRISGLIAVGLVLGQSEAGATGQKNGGPRHHAQRLCHHIAPYPQSEKTAEGCRSAETAERVARSREASRINLSFSDGAATPAGGIVAPRPER